MCLCQTHRALTLCTCSGAVVCVVLCYLPQWDELVGIPSSRQHYVTGGPHKT